MVQLRKARLEIFGPQKRVFHALSGNDMGFYLRNFGAMEVNTRAKKGYSKIIYYRIWKSANNAIRRILHRYALENGYNEKDFRACKSKRKTECFVTGKSRGGLSIFQNLFFPLQDRSFSFTFVRNPIDRFISAYIEIERSLEKSVLLDLKYDVGSYERFVEFINIILLANASKKLFLEKKIDFSKAAPMVGSLNLGMSLQRVGSNRFRLYRLENFDEDWDTLVEDSGLRKLAKIGDEVGLEHHVHADFKNISAVIRSFWHPVLSLDTLEKVTEIEKNLTHYQRKGNETGFHLSRRRAQKNEMAYFYLRAFCRIYLVDYICAGYELPIICQDLYSEVKEIMIERRQNFAEKRQIGWDIFVPHFLKSLIADIYCFRAADPQCHADFMSHKDFFPDDEDDADMREEL
jgi:hypothetical protein